jgi:hypothetical protein
MNGEESKEKVLIKWSNRMKSDSRKGKRAQENERKGEGREEKRGQEKERKGEGREGKRGQENEMKGEVREERARKRKEKGEVTGREKERVSWYLKFLRLPMGLPAMRTRCAGDFCLLLSRTPSPPVLRMRKHINIYRYNHYYTWH